MVEKEKVVLQEDLKQSGEDFLFEGKPFSGISADFYKNGKKKYERHYKHGKKEGRWTSWYENGKKKVEKDFKRGMEEGLWTDWSEDGKKTYQGLFVNGNER